MSLEELERLKTKEISRGEGRKKLNSPMEVIRNMKGKVHHNGNRWKIRQLALQNRIDDTMAKDTVWLVKDLHNERRWLISTGEKKSEGETDTTYRRWKYERVVDGDVDEVKKSYDDEPEWTGEEDDNVADSRTFQIEDGEIVAVEIHGYKCPIREDKTIPANGETIRELEEHARTVEKHTSRKDFVNIGKAMAGDLDVDEYSGKTWTERRVKALLRDATPDQRVFIEEVVEAYPKPLHSQDLGWESNRLQGVRIGLSSTGFNDVVSDKSDVEIVGYDDDYGRRKPETEYNGKLYMLDHDVADVFKKVMRDED